MSFSSSGSVRSVQPRKQRKFRFRAPLHMRGHFVHSHLSKDLRKQVKKRAVRVRSGDIVRIVRGRFAKKEGRVIGVDLRAGKIYIEGVTQRKARGQEARMPIDPSNVVITKLAEGK